MTVKLAKGVDIKQFEIAELYEIRNTICPFCSMRMLQELRGLVQCVNGACRARGKIEK